MSTGQPPNSALEAFFADFNPATCPVIARSTQGIIVRAQTDGLELAVKIPTGKGAARWLHRMALRREHAAYRHLRGIKGFPVCYGFYKDHFLALQYLDARQLREAELTDREEFFDQLLQVINQMHDHGVAHGDLKSKHNIMVTSTGEPVIIDLGTTVVRKPGWHPLNQRLFDYMRRIDRNAWVKLKYGGYDGVHEADRHLLNRSLIERINHRFRLPRR